MSRSSYDIDIEPPPKDDSPWLSKFYGVIQRHWKQQAIVLNHQISLGDGTVPGNVDGIWVDAVSVAGNFTVTHNLGRVPVGWHMVTTDAFENLKFISSTTTQITLAGQNGGANIKLFIF